MLSCMKIPGHRDFVIANSLKINRLTTVLNVLNVKIGALKIFLYQSGSKKLTIGWGQRNDTINAIIEIYKR